MISPQLLYGLLVQLSLFAVGATLATALVLVKRRPPFWWAYTGYKLATLGIISTIMVLVLPLQQLEPRLATYLYISFVGLADLMLPFVCRDILRRTGRRSGIEKLRIEQHLGTGFTLDEE